MGDVFAEQKDFPAALAAYRQALVIAERLAAANPSDGAAQYDLAALLARLGEVLHTLRDTAESRRAWRRARALLAPFVTRRGAPSEWIEIDRFLAKQGI